MVVLYVNAGCYCHCNPQKYCKKWLLTDFGFTTIVPSGQVGLSQARRGTPGYLGPEFVTDYSLGDKPAEYTTSADIWAIGCIIFELATAKKRRAFGYDDWPLHKYSNGLSLVPQLANVDNPSLETHVFDPASNARLPLLQQLNTILKSCFDLDPAKRINVLELKARFEHIKVYLTEGRSH
jgi:serine/threonine protein kinase